MRFHKSKAVLRATLVVVTALTAATLFGGTTRSATVVAPGGKAVPQDVPGIYSPATPVTIAPSHNSSRPTCLTNECFRAQGGRVARAFPDRPKSSWCIPATTSVEENSFRDGKWQGLLLVKVPKCASSTAAGLALRIANRTSCTAQYEHREGINYKERHEKSFLFATVRQPASRAFSMAYFFIIAPLNITPSDENIIKSVNRRRGGKTKGKGGFMFNYLTLRKVPGQSVWTPERPKQVLNETLVLDYMREIVHTYDFLMVVERMDESLTALALLTGLELGEVLSTNSKVAGQYLLSTTGKNKGKCVKQTKGKVSVGVKGYFESSMWKAMNYADYVLYSAANQSLDLTIERIGRERFQGALADFRRLKAKALDICGEHLGLGCTGDGVPLPEGQCYLRDFGCGYQCVDAMLGNTTQYM